MLLVSVLPPENQGDLGVILQMEPWGIVDLWRRVGEGVSGDLTSVGTSQLLGVAEEAEVSCLLPGRKTHWGWGVHNRRAKAPYNTLYKVYGLFILFWNNQ